MSGSRSGGADQSRFHPACPPDCTAAADPSENNLSESSAPLNLLVAEDDPHLRLALDRLLTDAGFNVWLAADGQEARELYRRHGQAIHLVLLDVNMPRANGPQTMTALQALNPAVCCCFMSGTLSAEDERDLRARGAVHCFRKPFALGELTGHLRVLAASAAVSVGH